MAQADLSVVGAQGTLGRYLVSGGTQILHGEPVHNLNTGLSSGVTSVNTYVLAAADTPVLDAAGSSTHQFGGISLENSLNVAAGTVKEQFLNCACPVPQIGVIRGKAQTVAFVDTLTELGLLIGDAVLIDYSSAGATDGGELYTIKTTEDSPANTSGLTIIGGNVATQVLDTVVHGNVYRNDHIA